MTAPVDGYVWWVAGDVDVLRAALDKDAAWWSPDAVPATLAMAALGRTLVQGCAALPREQVVAVLARVERVMRDGTEAEKDAAATGLLEAMVSAIDRAPEHAWLFEVLGAESKKYVEASKDFAEGRAPRR